MVNIDIIIYILKSFHSRYQNDIIEKATAKIRYS